MLGTFHSKSFIKEFGTEGVVGEDKKISNIKVFSLPDEPGREFVTYTFESEALFNKKAFGRKKTIQVPIKLPFFPTKKFMTMELLEIKTYVQIATIMVQKTFSTSGIQIKRLPLKKEILPKFLEQKELLKGYLKQKELFPITIKSLVIMGMEKRLN